MHPSTLLLSTLLALVATAALPVTLSSGKVDTEPRVVPPTAVQEQPTDGPRAKRAPVGRHEIRWRRSVALGSPTAGRLVRGVRLPARGADFATWDPNLHRTPNRAWRRWGTNRLVRLLLGIAREYRTAHPHARPMLIGDLSRPHGGDFGRQFGYVWHASHQNGLDVDIYFPRTDRVRRAPRTAADIDRRLSQDLVDRFVRAGATDVFVGPGTGLNGPPGVVQVIPHHDDHMHVRIGP
ncbi:MAG TPA: penicillin-insensitive murein endopeptidase [Actinophytocola sp.]|nr:penicillin-insensitive murein endopeptidase [Actinophytocola sp.]